MKTEQELKDELEDIFFDALTDKSNPPYYTDKVDPENDGCWQWKVYELCADELIKRGYGDVSEYKAEIERLKTENEILKTNLRKLEEKCAEFDKLCYDYNKSLYTMRCNMTSVTRYVRNENEAYNARYKELAEKAVENILKTINHKGEE